MAGPRDYHTKQSKSDKDKCHMISLTCRIPPPQKKMGTNECIYETDSQTLKANMVTKAERWWWGGINREFGIGIRTTLLEKDNQQGPVV